MAMYTTLYSLIIAVLAIPSVVSASAKEDWWNPTTTTDQ